MRRAVSAGLAGLLVVGVILVIAFNHKSAGNPSSGSLVTVTGVIGSEKLPFFQDSRVQAAFASHGYNVQVDTAGSRQIATTTDLSKYDFAFPAGEPQANKIKSTRKISEVYQPFFTPMAIATYQPIVNLLIADGLASQNGGIYYLDVNKFLAAVAKNQRWSDIPGNSTYTAGKSILITSTDVMTSNSAAMYLSLASYSANSNNIVDSPAQADAVMPAVSPLFLKQGFTASSTEEPFNDYLTIGVGKTPMVMIYEAQYIGQELSGNGLPQGAVLMYPSPTVFSKHTLVPLDSKGDAIGKLLSTDQTLQHLAVDYGFRINDLAYMQNFTASHHVDVPSLTNVIDPPTFDNLEYMINAISKLNSQEAPTP